MGFSHPQAKGSQGAWKISLRGDRLCLSCGDEVLPPKFSGAAL